MKSRPITHWMVSSITNQLAVRAYGQRKAELEKQLSTLAYSLWEKRYSKYIEAIKKLPAPWQDRLAQSYVTLTDEDDRSNYTRIHFQDGVNAYGSGYGAILITADEYKAIADLEEKIKEIRNEARQAQQKAAAVIQSVNTTKQLLEVWPDIEPILRKVLGDEVKPQLPAVQNLAELNTLFDLPPEEENNVSA